MTRRQQSASRARWNTVLLISGIVGPLGMLLVTALMLFHIREDAWSTVDQTSENLLHVMEQDIARSIGLYDLSLQGVVENLRVAEVASLDPMLRQLVLFDRAASASDKGVMLILDEHGDIVEDMGVVPPRKGNYADRDYFQIHKARPDIGLFISKPLVSRLTGLPIIALSRRISKPDGSFGGVVVGTLRLSYFTRLFAQAGLGRDSAVNLFRDDGIRIARYPFADADIGASIAGSTPFQRFMQEDRGSFTASSVRDRVKRRYAFAHVAEFPLILDVAMSTEQIERGWQIEAFVIGSGSLLLCGSTIGLVFWAAREFRRRVASEEELARLSATDSLTGIANRRRFDQVLPSMLTEAEREERPLSLLIVDADHFKKINDGFGHQVGDEVLKALSRCLAAVVHREADLVCRLGGEEFALILPETDLKGAMLVADKIHLQVAGYKAWPAGIRPGAVTVSIGAACGGVAGTGSQDLYRAADAALYEAKGTGRNRTCCSCSPDGSRKSASLRVVGS